MFNEKYRFTEKWFDIAIPTWQQVFKQREATIENVLEIGCYEGRATVWLCENVLKAGAAYSIIDTFKGSPTEPGMAHIVSQVEQGISKIEENFLHNISFFNDINFDIHRGYSQKVLATFEHKEVYDLIYIDASHRSDDTFVDAYFAHKLLKPGGLLIFDDFGWKDPSDLSPVNSPELAIKTFYTLYEKEYSIVFQGYQIGLEKVNKNRVKLS